MATISGTVEIEQNDSTSTYGGATVYVINEVTQTVSQTTSNTDGTFSVSGLDAGTLHTVFAVADDGTQQFRSKTFPGIAP